MIKSILKAVKIVLALPFMIKAVWLLQSSNFTKLDHFSKHRFVKYKNDFIALYFLMYSKTCQGAYRLSYEYFLKMLKIQNVSFKTQKYFIYKVIGRLVDLKKYKDVIDYSGEILKEEKNDEARLLLLRVRCEACFKGGEYEKMLEVCEELGAKYTEDEEIIKFVQAYYEAYAKIQDK